MKNIRNICFVIILLIAASAVFADDLSIGEIKSRADNAAATCTNKIVTYVSDDCFYIKDSAAYTGIKVLKANSGRSVGDIVNVQGTLGTDSNGERYINPLAVNLISSTGTVSAVTMSNVAMGGGDYNYESDTGAGQAGITDASGTNNIGSYIRIFGTVSYSDSGSEFMYIDDGSGVYDGNKLNSDGVKGVRVFLNGAKAPLEKTYYAASGISSLMILNGKTVRLLLASSTTLSSDWKPVLDMSMAKISGGTFLMGNSGVGDDADFGYAREYPQHSVYVPGFWMSKTEVTRAQFNEFVKFGGYYRPQYWSKDGWNLPIIASSFSMMANLVFPVWAVYYRRQSVWI